MSFLNKIVVITGAGSGIGERTALHFAKQGARLSLIDKNEETLKKAVENCEKASKTRVYKIVADLTKDEEVKNAIERTVKEYGRIDILINSAGIYSSGSIFDGNLVENFDKVIQTNLRSVAVVIHYAAPTLIESSGVIVNVSSATSAIVTSNIPYSVASASLNHLTKCIALDLSSKGVRVNAIQPSTVKSNLMTNAGLNKTDVDIFYKETELLSPLKKLVKVEEVAETIAFLASDKARGITGSSFLIDCGTALLRAASM